MAYNPSELTWNSLAIGFGIGSIIPIKKSFFFSPELNSLSPLTSNNGRRLTSLIPFFGYSFNKHFSITAGTSVTWSYNDDHDDLSSPFFKIADFEINNNNNIVVGARAGILYCF